MSVSIFGKLGAGVAHELPGAVRHPDHVKPLLHVYPQLDAP